MSFDEQLKRSNEFEVAYANLLTKQGYFVLPAYDYSGRAKDKAPRLMGNGEYLVTPDLQVFCGGHGDWRELKLKTNAAFNRKYQHDVTGIEYRLWKQYRRVKIVTGLPVYLTFAHEKENVVCEAEIEQLEKYFSHAHDNWKNKHYPSLKGLYTDKPSAGTMIYFKFNALPRLPITITELHRYYVPERKS